MKLNLLILFLVIGSAFGFKQLEPVALSDCGKDYVTHVETVSAGYLNIANPHPPMVSWCAEPPAGYADCVAAARTTYNKEVTRLGKLLQKQVKENSKRAMGDIAEAKRLASSISGTPDEIEALYCRILGMFQDSFDHITDFNQGLYDFGIGLAAQAYIDALEDCCGPQGGMVAATSDCGCDAPDQFKSAEQAIQDVLDRDYQPFTIPYCYEQPPGYQDCVDAARADFDDAMFDAQTDAADWMEKALNTAKIKYAFAKAMRDRDDASEYDKRRACRQMTEAGNDAALAEWGGPEAVLEAYGKAIMAFYDAVDDCCYSWDK